MSAFSQFEIWTFFTGLGIFLFGMHMMKESIRILGGAAFKTIIHLKTYRNPVLGVLAKYLVRQFYRAVLQYHR
ncbi:hypothetical protein [Rhodohalobacter sp.]|uniref:hypothetical protein n=1 Tax=Rhodohalobacter sp. TaxID=1974210 RepID=UPI003564F72E